MHIDLARYIQSLCGEKPGRSPASVLSERSHTWLPGIGGLRAADGLLHDRRFAHHLPELEALLARAPIDSGRRMRLPADSLPRAVRDCCARLVLVRRDSVGQLSATFLGQRKTAYLYDPSGTRLVRGIGSRRWRSHERLAPDWYRVVRF